MESDDREAVRERLADRLDRLRGGGSQATRERQDRLLNLPAMDQPVSHHQPDGAADTAAFRQLMQHIEALVRDYVATNGKSSCPGSTGSAQASHAPTAPSSASSASSSSSRRIRAKSSGDLPPA